MSVTCFHPGILIDCVKFARSCTHVCPYIKQDYRHYHAAVAVQPPPPPPTPAALQWGGPKQPYELASLLSFPSPFHVILRTGVGLAPSLSVPP